MINLARSESDASLTLNLLRAVAAQMVCVGHAIIFFWGEIRPQGPIMQNVGVLIFFLISGFVIASTLWQRSYDEAYGFGRFFIDRFARIYSGLVPALTLIIVIDAATIYLTKEQTIARYYNVPTLLANLFMLEGYWGIFPNTLRYPTFGSASPLWTLAIEWHIYMFVGAIFFAIARRRNLLLLLCVAAFSGQIAIHYVAGSFQKEQNVGLGLFSLWLVGFALFFLLAPARRYYWLTCGAGVLAAIAYLKTTTEYQEYNFFGYVLLAIAFACLMSCVSATHRIKSIAAQRTIALFADYSFSLYLVHHTVIVFLFLATSLRGPVAFFTAIMLANALSFGIALIGERHHKALAAWLVRYFKMKNATV